MSLPSPAGFEKPRRNVAPTGSSPKEGATFSQVAIAPAGVVVMRSLDWAPTWETRPKGEVAIGLRPITPADAIEARRMAAEKAWEEHPKTDDHDLRTEAFNDALMRFVLARGTCDPNDARARCAVWRGIEDDIVFVALTREGARRLFDAHAAALIASDPSEGEASDQDVIALPILLARATLLRGDEARLRRLLGHVVRALQEAEAP